MRKLLMMCLVAGVAGLQGCKCQKEEKNETAKVEEKAEEATADKAEPAAKQELSKEEQEKAEYVKNIKKDMKIEDLKEGKGDEATPGHEIVVNYTSAVKDGIEFDSSYARKTPFTFRLGAGQAVAMWEEGIKGMKIGGKRKLTVPPELAYGKKGLSNVIPPDATIIYTIELLEVH